MSKILDKALATMAAMHADQECLTFRIYRGSACIDEFSGTKGEWFDRVMNDLDHGNGQNAGGRLH